MQTIFALLGKYFHNKAEVTKCNIEIYYIHVLSGERAELSNPIVKAKNYIEKLKSPIDFIS